MGEALDENFTALAEREKKKRGDSTGIIHTHALKLLGFCVHYTFLLVVF